MVVFHEVNFVCVGSVNVLHWLSQVILFRIKVCCVGEGGNCNSGLAVVIGWEYFGEGVSHSQLAIEGPRHECCVRVHSPIFQSMLSSGRDRVVAVIVE